MGGENKLPPPFPHGLHEREPVASRDAEAAGNPVRLQRRDNQIGIVHTRVITRVPSGSSCGKMRNGARLPAGTLSSGNLMAHMPRKGPGSSSGVMGVKMARGIRAGSEPIVATYQTSHIG